MEPTRDGGTDEKVKKPQKNSVLFPAIVLMSMERGRNDSADTVNLVKPISFSTVDTDVAFTGRTTYEIGENYEKYVKVMFTTVALLEHGAGVSLIHSALILPG